MEIHSSRSGPVSRFIWQGGKDKDAKHLGRMSWAAVLGLLSGGLTAGVARADTTVRASVSSAECRAALRAPRGCITRTVAGLSSRARQRSRFGRHQQPHGYLRARSAERHDGPREHSGSGTGNTQANESCTLGRVGVRYCSDDAHYVVFVSDSNNLVNNDTNGDNPPYHINGSDIFVDRDLDNDGIFDEAGVGNTKTVRVSVTTGEGQYIEFSSGVDTYSGGISDAISANGRYVAFESRAPSWVAGTAHPATIFTGVVGQ